MDNNYTEPLNQQPVEQNIEQPVQPVYVQPNCAPNHILDSLATTSLTMGILSLVFGCILGLIFSIIGKKKAAEYGRLAGAITGKAKAGAILNKIGFILSLISTIIVGIYLIVVVIIACIFAETNFHF